MLASTQILKRLDAYPDFLSPLTEATRRYVKYPSTLGKDGVMNIGHRPWVAPLNYMFVLYPEIKRTNLAKYCRRFQILVPEQYVDFLRALNGAFCFGMHFCGVPLSMLGDPPLLDRTILQCHDLVTVGDYWQVPRNFFRFGGRHWSYKENV